MGIARAMSTTREGEEEFLERLEAGRPGVELGLDKSQRLLEKLGWPQRELRVMHVGGTNGKGSVCAMMSSVLQAAGYSVGVFSSPHLHHWSEAVTVNGMVNVEAWRRAVGKVQRQLVEDGEDGKFTAFEAACAAMWVQLAERQVDYALIEVGVGGRLDATNVCEEVEVSIITSVGLDHQVMLLYLPPPPPPD